MAADTDPDALAPEGAGARLKRARQASGKSLADVSAATKIPERLLAAIEEGRFSSLPSRIYAIGFARSYARLVGLDETVIVNDVRAQIDGAADGSDIAPAQPFTPGDPARIPELRLAIGAGLIAILVLVAGLMIWHGSLGTAGSLPAIAPADPAPSAPQPIARAPIHGPAPAPIVPTGAAVTLSALAPGIWVKVYETSGRVLFEQQMTAGQTFVVPASAQAPLIWTGRPDALAITVAGKPVAKLSETQKIIKGVPISATALLARIPPAIVTMPLPGPVPVNAH